MLRLLTNDNVVNANNSNTPDHNNDHKVVDINSTKTKHGRTNIRSTGFCQTYQRIKVRRLFLFSAQAGRDTSEYIINLSELLERRSIVDGATDCSPTIVSSTHTHGVTTPTDCFTSKSAMHVQHTTLQYLLAPHGCQCRPQCTRMPRLPRKEPKVSPLT